MRSENFVAFFVVSGFFIGVSFGILKANTIMEFFSYVFFVVLFFYLFIHIVLILFFNIEPKVADTFDKKEYEDYINTQIKKLKEQEKRIGELLAGIKTLKS